MLQGQPEQKMFEFYSCYENLHLEIVSNWTKIIIVHMYNDDDNDNLYWLRSM